MTLRKIFGKIHLYLGLTVGLLFALMGLSGSLLVFSEEIDAALNPRLLRVAPLENQASFSVVEQNVRANFPDDKIHRIKMPLDSKDVYEFWMNSNEGLRVYVNPYTAEITGSRIFSRTFRGILFNLHTQLLSGETGKTIVGAAAFFFLAIGLSGIVLWWRGWRHVKRGLKINFKSNRKRIIFDTHNAVGFFSFIFLSVSAFTGVHLVFNQPFERAVNWLTATPNRQSPPVSQAQSEARTLTVGEIKNLSDRIWAEAETVWIYPPANSAAAFMVRKKFPAENHPSGKSFLFFDQYTGEILREENALDAPAPTRAVNNLYPLHIGRIAGLTTKVLQVGVGLTPIILLFTGFLIYRNGARKTKRQHTPIDKN
jgi:uncharacterized iron-regulated membrane protein